MQDEKTLALRKMNSEHFAARVMNSASFEVSESMDSFSNWIAGGAGASIGLLLANLEELSKFVPSSAVGKAAGLLAWVLGVALVQKIPASIVASRMRAYELGWKQGLEAAQAGVDLDFAFITSRVVDALPRLLKRRAKSKVEADLMALPRGAIRLVFFQGFLVLVEIILVLCAVLSVTSWLVA